MSKRRISPANTRSYRLGYVFGFIAYILLILLFTVYIGFMGIFIGIVGMGFLAYQLRYIFVLKHVYLDDFGVYYSPDESNYYLMKWHAVKYMDVAKFNFDSQNIYVLHSFDGDEIAFMIDGDGNSGKRTQHGLREEALIRGHISKEEGNNA